MRIKRWFIKLLLGLLNKMQVAVILNVTIGHDYMIKPKSGYMGIGVNCNSKVVGFEKWDGLINVRVAKFGENGD